MLATLTLVAHFSALVTLQLRQMTQHISRLATISKPPAMAIIILKSSFSIIILTSSTHLGREALGSSESALIVPQPLGNLNMPPSVEGA